MTPLAAAANENLAEISNYLIYSSMAVYTLAFFAHIAEWTFGSRSKVARTAAALTGAGQAGAGQAGAAAPAVQVRGKGGSTAVLDQPKVVTRSASRHPRRAGRPRRHAAAPCRATCTGGSRSR